MYRLFAIGAAALLFIGVADLPYGYYTFLRLAVCVTAGFGAFSALENESPGWTFVLAAVAILWNPIIPVHLNKELWVVLDVIGGAIMLISAFQVEPSSAEVEA